MSSKVYYANDEHYHLETTALSRIPSKSSQLRFSQTVEGLQSGSVGQNINLVDLERVRISTVASLQQYEPKIAVSSRQSAKASFEHDNFLQLSSWSYSSIHKTYRRIAELGADNETYKYTIEWLDILRTVVAANQMWWGEPLVNLSFDSEIVFEWWHGTQKLTVYILGNTAEYIKVWGPDIDNQMEDGTSSSPAELTDLWKWLVS
ncbi:hypothetical protein [Nostoc sp. CALU 1950]|uniref:hypothetical protein n=1 Tax=Nostoc sp. CALU 1950 TaxID=3104321 RepID=UPI003EBCBA78